MKRVNTDGAVGANENGTYVLFADAQAEITTRDTRIAGLEAELRVLRSFLALAESRLNQGLAAARREAGARTRAGDVKGGT